MCEIKVTRDLAIKRRKELTDSCMLKLSYGRFKSSIFKKSNSATK